MNEDHRDFSIGAFGNDDTFSNTTNDYFLVRFTGTSITPWNASASSFASRPAWVTSTTAGIVRCGRSCVS
jgi:hypothetical protein